MSPNKFKDPEDLKRYIDNLSETQLLDFETNGLPAEVVFILANSEKVDKIQE